MAGVARAQLTDRERAVLEFARRQFAFAGHREQAILDRFRMTDPLRPGGQTRCSTDPRHSNTTRDW
jgi:hypothetical protein